MSHLVRAGRLLAGLFLALITTVLVAGPSSAHSQLVATDPADQSKISVVPAAVTMTFNENVIGLGTRVQVTGPGGDVTSGPTTVTDNVVRQAVAANAPAGAYTVLWKVTSGDGHPVSGSFTFTATSAAGSPPVSASPAESVAPATATPTPTVAGLPASSTSGGTGSSTSSLFVLGAGVVLLIVLIAIFAAISRIWRARRSAPPGRPGHAGQAGRAGQAE